MKLIPYQYTEIIFIIHLSICHGLLFICDWWHIEHFMDRYFLKWLPGNLIFKIIYFRLRWYKMPKFEEMKQMYSVYGYMHKIHVFWFPWNIITSILVSYYIHVHLFIEKKPLEHNTLYNMIFLLFVDCVWRGACSFIILYLN